jgi:predicted component of type VI protein secretion system
MGAWVIVQRGGVVGARYALDAPRLTIGRSPDNDLVLDDPAVDRYHAAVVGQGMHWAILDLGGVRPVEVEGHTLEPGEPHPLRHGDAIAIGGVVLLFHQPAEGVDLAAQPTLRRRALPASLDATMQLPTHAPAATPAPPPPAPSPSGDDDPTLPIPTTPPAPHDPPADGGPAAPNRPASPPWLGARWRPRARRDGR